MAWHPHNVMMDQALLMGRTGLHRRRWMTNYFLNRWMENKIFYYWQISGQAPDNPDQRISEDISTSEILSSVGVLPHWPGALETGKHRK